MRPPVLHPASGGTSAATATPALPLDRQIGYLVAAFALGSAVGMEGQLREKTAGLRTHTVVSVGAALFMLISMNGFADVAGDRGVSLDPSRVAAQIVSAVLYVVVVVGYRLVDQVLEDRRAKRPPG